MDSVEIQVTTGYRLVTDLTAASPTSAAGRGDGLLNVFVPHATAGLAIVETGSGTEEDLADLVDRPAAAEDRYRHRHGTRDMVATTRFSAGLALADPAVVAGRPTLGTWQSLVLVDCNVDNPVRQVRLSFLAG